MYSVLHLGLSYACNMNCAHCFVNKKRDRLDFDTIQLTLESLVERYGLFIIYYTHGEPLLYKDFFEVSHFCNKLGLVQVLMTNGSLIDQAIARKLRDSGIATVYVSVDSHNPKRHDANRGLPGAFEQASKAIQYLQKMGISVGISTTITLDNVEECREIYEFAKTQGVNALSLLTQRDKGNLIPISGHPSFQSFLKWYFTHPQEQSTLNLFLHDPSLLSFINSLYKERAICETLYEKYFTMNTCHVNTSLSITPDGSVAHCNLSPVEIGNICDLPIETILDKENDCYECPICCP